MNAVALSHEAEDVALTSEVDAWHRLGEIQVPVTVAWGDLDVPVIIDQSRHLADHLPDARGQVIPQTAHLPYVERPELVAELIRETVTPPSRPDAHPFQNCRRTTKIVPIQIAVCRQFSREDREPVARPQATEGLRSGS